MDLIKGLLLSSLLITAVGCAPSASSTTDGGAPAQDSTKTGPIPKKCDDLAFSEGKTANLSLLSNMQTEVTNFGKEFHGNILDAVSEASAEETIKVLKKFKLPIFKGPEGKLINQSKKCMFESLPEATGEAKSIWKEANSGNAPGQTILGLYMGKEKVVSGKYVQDPVMIIKYDTNRWTLVHEAMHFLFHKWEVEEGTPDSKLEDEIVAVEQETETVFQAFKNSKKGKDFANFVLSFDRYLKINHVFMKRHPLEESTVEDTLAERYVKGLLTFVPSADAYDNWYLLTNLKKAAPMYVEQMSAQKDSTGRDAINTYWIKKSTTEVLANIDVQLLDVDQKIAAVVVDTPEKQKEKDALVLQRAMLVAEQTEYKSALTTVTKTEEFLTQVIQEIQLLADKSIARTKNAPKDANPFTALSKVAFAGVGFNSLAHVAEDRVKGCTFNNFEVPKLEINY